MSVDYGIEVDLSVTHNHENIYDLLEKGKTAFNFRYFLMAFNKPNCKGEEFSVKQASEALIKGTPDETMHSLVISYLDMIFFVHVVNNNGYIGVSFSGFCYRPKNKTILFFRDKKEVLDIKFYSELLLEFVAIYPIVRFEIWDGE